MARHTFFSFHYKPDVRRAWVVRNSWVTKVARGEREDAGDAEEDDEGRVGVDASPPGEDQERERAEDD